MTKPLTNAEKGRRFRQRMRERMQAARRRAAAINAATAVHKGHATPLPDARKTGVRVSSSGRLYYADRRGVSLAVIRGYYDG
jgi:hypothetical protein